MTKAARQARWRKRDSKKMLQVRLTPEAMERVDALVRRAGASGRAELIERILMADAGPSPEWVQHEAVRLARAWFRTTEQRSFSLKDEDFRYEITKHGRAW